MFWKCLSKIISPDIWWLEILEFGSQVRMLRTDVSVLEETWDAMYYEYQGGCSTKVRPFLAGQSTLNAAGLWLGT